MRKKLQLLFILVLSFIKGQNPIDIVPPSPQAEEMVKYGNQPLNEYKGMAQINIPLVDIKEKNISTNVNLVYSKLGVRVNDLSNNVGVSWLLDMGGVITRTVYDVPDERNPTTRLIFDNLSYIQTIPYIKDGTNEADQLNDYIKNLSYDREFDIFSVSVNGISGKFYLDRDLNPILITNNHQFKIESVGDFRATHAFVLTANDGTQYYFGGEDAIEETLIREVGIYDRYVTGFYLTKIKNTNGDEMFFEYQSVGSKYFLTSVTESKSINVEKYSNCGPGTPTRNLDIPNSIRNNHLRLNKAKVLSSIISDEKMVRFHYLSAPVSSNDKLILIEVFNNFTNKKTQEFEFNYLDKISPITNVLQRYFLTNIKKYNYQNDIRNYESEYSFSYDDPLGIPDRNSYSVDVFGYFNNKVNTTFLPNLKLLNPTNNILDGIPGNYADRTSYFNFSKKGTLTSITYPTKGTTHFEYEGIPQKIMVYDGLENQVYSNLYQTVSQTESILDGNKVYDGIVKGTLHIEQPNPSAMPAKNGSINLSVIDISNPTILIVNQNINIDKLRPEEDPDVPQLKEIPINFVVEKNKQYKIILKLNKNNIYYSGSFSINYKSHYIQQNISGLRLKKTYDVAENNSLSNVKRIYYSSYDIINNVENLPDYLYPYSYFNTYFDLTGCVAPNGGLSLLSAAQEQTMLSSDPVNRYFDGENPDYPTYTNIVVSYGGDNFEKGGEEKTFVNGQFGISQPYKIPSNSDLYRDWVGTAASINTLALSFQRVFLYDDYNGKILENKIFSNNGNLYLRKKINFNYDQQIIGTKYNLMGSQSAPLWMVGPPLTFNNVVSNLLVLVNPIVSYNIYLNNQIEKNYIDNVPINTVDDTPYKKLITTTNYFYNNPSHYQLTSQKTTFPDLSYQTTDYRYAHEKSNTYLMGKNMIGIPLETQVIKTASGITKTISKTETLYPVNQPDANVTTSGLPLPKSVSTLDLITGNLSTEVTYDQYDSHGNLQQYTTKLGVSTAIVWGYNSTQPIAKIEGAKYSQVSSYITNIVGKSDADNLSGTTSSEQDVVDALDLFRQKSELSGFQITTYSYDLLIGVKSITPPNGIRQVYIYDAANRLKEVREHNQTGNLLKEYQYNYKH
jgi:hypothetical protein